MLVGLFVEKGRKRALFKRNLPVSDEDASGGVTLVWHCSGVVYCLCWQLLSYATTPFQSCDLNNCNLYLDPLSSDKPCPEHSLGPRSQAPNSGQRRRSTKGAVFRRAGPSPLEAGPGRRGSGYLSRADGGKEKFRDHGVEHLFRRPPNYRANMGLKTTVLPNEEGKQTTLGEPGIAIPKNPEEISAFKEVRDVDAKKLNEEFKKEEAAAKEAAKSK